MGIAHVCEREQLGEIHVCVRGAGRSLGVSDVCVGE